MDEKSKDAEDRLLQSMFATEVIADDGFSERIVARIRLAIWMRRLAMPTALLIGGAIAVKSLLQLAPIFSLLSDSMPSVSSGLSATMLTQLPIVLTVGCLMLIGIVMIQLSEE